MNRPSVAVCLTMLVLLVHSSSAQVDQATIVSVHNAARAEVGVKAASWDASLAASAESYAATCPSDHSTLTNAEAENLGWGFPTITEKGVSDAWIAEKADLSNGVCADGKVCSHYQTIVNPKMDLIGCATKLACAAMGKDNAQTWVCHYKESAPGSTPAPTVASDSAAPNSTASNSTAAPNSTAPNSTALNSNSPASTNLTSSASPLPSNSSPGSASPLPSNSSSGSASPSITSPSSTASNPMTATGNATMSNMTGVVANSPLSVDPQRNLAASSALQAAANIPVHVPRLFKHRPEVNATGGQYGTSDSSNCDGK